MRSRAAAVGTLQWEAAQLLPGNGTNALTVSINGAGAYALVVADAPPQAPPLPQAGQPLLPSAAPAPDPSALTAGGTGNQAAQLSRLNPTNFITNYSPWLGN